MNSKEKPATEQAIRLNFISSGVKKIKNYGFTKVTEDNIISDSLYKEFFKKFLLSNVAQDEKTINVIAGLLKEISG
jgi:hypothetical protein